MGFFTGTGNYVYGREEHQTSDELWEQNRLSDWDIDRLWEEWMDRQEARKEMTTKDDEIERRNK